MSQSEIDANKAAVRRFLESMPERDLDAIASCLAEDVLQHYQRPSNRADDGSKGAQAKNSREKILDEIGTYFYQLYRKGTIEVEILHLVGEGEFVAAHFVLRALTARKGEPYENFYHFLYRCRGGVIVEYWEYIDTAYANRMLFD